MGYHKGLHYAGEQPTKFGIFREQFGEALAVAREYHLPVKILHFHLGSGYLNSGLADLAIVLERCSWFVQQCPNLEILDVGGGLGVPLTATDEPLDLARWAGILGAFACPRGLKIHVEPVDFIVKNAGLLVTEINTVETNADTLLWGSMGVSTCSR